MENPRDVMSRITGRAIDSQENGKVITTSFGHPLPDVSHALQIDGRPVSSDVFLFEKQQAFNRAKTLERMVHPSGSGAFGYFQVTDDVSHLCKASFLSSVGKRTPIFVRFSTVTLGREFPDSARNPRGFAVKFYTEDGNYDIVGLNWPVFFNRDPMKGPDVVRSQQRKPQNFLLNYDATFDYFTANPESLHAGAMLFSDSGTPVGWRFMNGFGCHAFKWVDDSGRHVYVKYHFLPENGRKDFTFEQAQLMSGVDPDFAKRDLYEHIESGHEAVWKVCIQIMTEEQANDVAYDPFDVTKVWLKDDFPLHKVGKLVLDKNPENYHRDVEQAAFSPGNLVAGIEPSPDLLLNWRMFFYRDAQYHRLGVNHHQIPVNCPFMSRYFSPQTRDGLLRGDSNGGNILPYAATVRDKRQTVFSSSDYQPVKIDGMLERGRSSRTEGQDSEYEQVRRFYQKVLSDAQKANLHKNTALCLRFCSEAIVTAYLDSLAKIDPAYRDGVRNALENCPKPNSVDEYDKVVDIASAETRV